jgi:hypothetical protein
MPLKIQHDKKKIMQHKTLFLAKEVRPYLQPQVLDKICCVPSKM